MTYELLGPLGDSGTKAIRCLLCGTVSDNPTDVTQRYCSRCDRYHGCEIELAQTALVTGIQHARPDLDQAATAILLGEMLVLLSPANTPIRPAPQWSDPSFREGGSMDSPAPDAPKHRVLDVLYNELANGRWITCSCGFETAAHSLLENAGREFDEHLKQVKEAANANG